MSVLLGSRFALCCSPCLGVILGSYGSRSLATCSARLCPAALRMFGDRCHHLPVGSAPSSTAPGVGRLLLDGPRWLRVAGSAHLGIQSSRSSSGFLVMPLTGMCPHCFKCRQYQQHPWLRAPIAPGRHGECGHGFPPCGQAASSVTACFHLISPSFSPSHLWASATVSLPALYWLLEEWTAVVLCMPAGIRLHVWLAQRALAQLWRRPAYSPRVAHPPPQHTPSFGHFRITLCSPLSSTCLRPPWSQVQGSQHTRWTLATLPRPELYDHA